MTPARSTASSGCARRRWRPASLVALCCAVVLAACAEPTLREPAEDDAPAQPEPPADTVPAERTPLDDQVDALLAAVRTAHGHLAAAATARSLPAAQRAGASAVDQLLGGPEPAAAGGTRPLLPAVTVDRDEVGVHDDVLTTTLTAVREAGGSRAARVLAVLRDPMVGDLGAWERDAAGMVERIRTAADGTAIAAIEDAVLALDGDVPRALAWAMVTAEAEDLHLATAAAARGAVHLELVLLAVERQLDAAGEVGP
jgi:hypothetical protein